MRMSKCFRFNWATDPYRTARTEGRDQTTVGCSL